MMIVQSVLGWGAILNLGLLVYWFLLYIYAHDALYRLHSRWFSVSVETFDAIHYAGLGLYKILIIVTMIIPYLVLCCIT